MNSPDTLSKYVNELFSLMSEELKIPKTDLMIEYIKLGDLNVFKCIMNNDYEPIMLAEEIAIYYNSAEKIFDKYTGEKK